MARECKLTSMVVTRMKQAAGSTELHYAVRALFLLAIAATCVSCRRPNPTQQVIEGWHTQAPSDNGFAVRLDDATHNGRRIVVLTNERSDATGIGTIVRRIPAAPYRGRRLRFSALLRTKDVIRGAALWMRIDGPDRPVAFDNMQDRRVLGTVDWTQYNIVLDVPPNAQEIAYGVLQVGCGSTWIDGAAVTPVGNDFAPTNKLTAAQLAKLPPPSGKECDCDKK